MKRDVFTYGFLETGGTAYHSGPPGEGPELLRRKRGGGRIMAQSLYQGEKNGSGRTVMLSKL